ncbi:FkbM family methyltransferase [Ancylobacter sp. VNQ12]|uniref:FkbM family methyltransferase n=1 Tax=Ancylobacter sp. VNQ12 TaxID=3400920 RepID=UPI003C0385EF
MSHELPLNQLRLTEDEVREAYIGLLGRPPERSGLAQEAGALDALLSIATSPEHQNFIAAQLADGPHGGRYCITNIDSGAFVTYRSDRIIGESLRRSGKFEESGIDEAIGLIERSGRTVRRSVFVDVGANIGTHNIHALKTGFARAVCVEADIDNFRILRVNQILNDIDDRCTNFLAAASEQDGEAELELSPTNFGDHRLRAVDDGLSVHGESNWSTRRIRRMRLSSVLAEAKVGIDDIGLVWVDTQGHDGHVLAGAPELLASRVPIVTEFWPYGLHRSGGFGLLQQAMRGREVIDLRQSLRQDSLCVIDSERLVALYDELLADESVERSPHTDLLLL